VQPDQPRLESPGTTYNSTSQLTSSSPRPVIRSLDTLTLQLSTSTFNNLNLIQYDWP
jgi:hypothetical protein